MKKTTMITALTTVLLLAGCACVSTEYKAFQGVREGIIDGKGGSKVVVDGMEIWDSGEPPRKFKIMGFIDDNRGAGWMYTHATSSVRDDIVEKAREAGGDAVIKMNTQSQLAEFYKAGGASVNVYGSYPSTVYGSSDRSLSKYAVIKYLK
ncbi:MAG: hypothetical protein ACXV7H_06675 [Methylobacter sp.]